MNPKESVSMQSIPQVKNILWWASEQIKDVVGKEVEVKVFSKVQKRENCDEEISSLIHSFCVAWSVTEDYVLQKTKKVEPVVMRQILAMKIREKFPVATGISMAVALGFKNNYSFNYSVRQAKDLLEVQDDAFMKLYNQVQHLF
jgi:hypothetical protein